MLAVRDASQVEGSAGEVHGRHLAHLPGEGRIVGALLLLARVVGIAAPEVEVLGGKGVSPRLLAVPGLVDGADWLQEADGIVLVEELLRGELHQPMELPPHRLVLATMPAEELSQQPASLIRSRTRRRVDFDVLGQPVDEALYPCPGGGQVLGQLLHALDGAGNLLSRHRRQLGATLLQPVPQQLVADHIVAVVGLDPLEVGRRRAVAFAELEPFLEGDDARPGVAQVDLAVEPVEALEALDRVALDRGTERLANDTQEVDEDVPAKESIDLVLTGPVSAHQALQCRRLIRCVVVDVEGRISCQPLDDEVDQLLERHLLRGQRELAGLVTRPERVECAIGFQDAEEIVETVLERVRVALDVEEQVVRRRLRKAREATFRFDQHAGSRRKQLVPQPPLEPALELDSSLLPNSREGSGTRSLDRRHHGQVQTAEIGERLDPTGCERSALATGDPRHETEVIVVAPALDAFDRPAADVAMFDWVRVRIERRIGDPRVHRHRREESIPDASVVRHEVVDAKPLDRS